MKFRARCLLAVGVASAMLVGGAVYGGTVYSFDVTSIHYDNGDPGFVIDDSFGTDGMSGENVVIGSGVVTDPPGYVSNPYWFQWDPSARLTTTLEGVSPTVMRMTFDTSSPAPVWAAQALAGDITKWEFVRESHVSAHATNFTGVDDPNFKYSFGVLMTVFDSVNTLEVNARWYDGSSGGGPFQPTLQLSAETWDRTTDTILQQTPFVVETGLDPLTTDLELGLDLFVVSGGATFAYGWYDVNGGGPQSLGAFWFSPAPGVFDPAPGFPKGRPGVSGGVPEPASLGLLIVGLAGIAAGRARGRKRQALASCRRGE
jgi:hypothetical protein